MRCISVNGKDFFLIRGYQRDYRSFIFVQVAGNTALNKEDLPSKGWEVLRARTGKDRVWTAYRKSYFQYQTRRADPTLAFVGASTEGSYFLALREIARRFCLRCEDGDIQTSAERYARGEMSHWRMERLHDKGNTGVYAVLVEFSSFDKEEAMTLFRGG
jgi:hypothetical protein